MKNELVYWRNTPREVRYPVIGEKVDYEGINMRFVLKYIPGHHAGIGRLITSEFTGKPETQVSMWEVKTNG